MENGTIKGRVLKYGDNINTDLISPAPYVGLAREIMLAHGMEGVDPEFPQKVRPGDIIVAGKNFGSGSSRETAAYILRESGVGAVISPLFARIFYRNAINIGLPVFVLPEADRIGDGDILEITPAEGRVDDLTTGESFSCGKIPPALMALIEDGGLIRHLEKRFAEEKPHESAPL